MRGGAQARDTSPDHQRLAACALAAKSGSKSGAAVGSSQLRSADAASMGAMKRVRKQAARRYTPSQKAQSLELAASAGVSAATRQLHVSCFALRPECKNFRSQTSSDASCVTV